ncbi:MAG: DEAD/DEAH box helicase [Gammaproteobacteria bacterium]|nr:DEAD/DEAH box helicase [Gammaproteobacteria bacterium]
MTFASLGLSEPLLRALADKGYEHPTPVQLQAIPSIISGHDMMAAAQTGTGKTAGFTLPLLERLNGGKSAKPNCVRALVLTPTRELAAQVGESVAQYGKYLALRSAVVFGGVKINPQMMKLRKGVDVLVATPGRLMDLYQQNAVKFNQVEILVLDEADRMLDMGFINDIRKILALMPKRRQNLLFSATFSDDIRKLAKGLLHNPVEIDVSPRNTTTSTVSQLVHPVDKTKKSALLVHLINENTWEQVLVFTRTKRGANRLVEYFGKNNISAAAIHGNKSQGARTRALADFKNGKMRVLVATDLAARGIDISDLPHVVNFDLPDVAENYVHRIGRTGRGGAVGEAVSLVCADEIELLSDIESLTGKLLERKLVEGFEPKQKLPVTELKKKKAPKKPKKPKVKKAFTAEAHSNEKNANKNSVNKSSKNGSDSNSKPQSKSKPKKRKRQSDTDNVSQSKRKPAKKSGGKPTSKNPWPGKPAKPKKKSGPAK